MGGGGGGQLKTELFEFFCVYVCLDRYFYHYYRWYK